MEFCWLLARRREIRSHDHLRNSKRPTGRLAARLLIAVLIVGLPGCRRHNQEPTADIIFVNAVPDADSISVSADHVTLIRSATFGSATDYSQIPIGAYTIHVTAVTDHHSVDFPPIRYTLEQDQYTVVTAGEAAGEPKARLLMFDDSSADNVPSDQAEVTVVDAYPHSHSLDVALNNVVAFSSIPFGSESKPLQLPANAYVCKAIPTESYTDPIAGPLRLNLEGGKSYRLIIVGSTAEKQPGILVEKLN